MAIVKSAHRVTPRSTWTYVAPASPRSTNRITDFPELFRRCLPDRAAGYSRTAQTAYSLASDEETLFDLQSSLLFAQLAAKKHADALKTAATGADQIFTSAPNAASWRCSRLPRPRS